MHPDYQDYLKRQLDQYRFAYARLIRGSSGLTYKLPKPLTLNEAEEFVRDTLPGWEMVSLSMDNPDDESE